MNAKQAADFRTSPFYVQVAPIKLSREFVAKYLPARHLASVEIEINSATSLVRK